MTVVVVCEILRVLCCRWAEKRCREGTGEAEEGPPAAAGRATALPEPWSQNGRPGDHSTPTGEGEVWSKMAATHFAVSLYNTNFIKMLICCKITECCITKSYCDIYHKIYEKEGILLHSKSNHPTVAWSMSLIVCYRAENSIAILQYYNVQYLCNKVLNHIQYMFSFLLGYWEDGEGLGYKA